MARSGTGRWVCGAALGALLAGCNAAPEVRSASAPVAAPAAADNSPEALLARMSIERKVAQIVQPDIGSITPADVREYRFGTILNGGNSGPYGNDKGPATDWLKLADEYWEASTAPLPNGEPVIPAIWATDAVHGHANVPGATVFPHNIGLGATGDADLIRRIGAATAVEIEVTGLDWTFAPTVAVARDDRLHRFERIPAARLICWGQWAECSLLVSPRAWRPRRECFKTAGSDLTHPGFQAPRACGATAALFR